MHEISGPCHMTQLEDMGEQVSLFKLDLIGTILLNIKIISHSWDLMMVFYSYNIIY
jgi:hypothetical protein